MENFCTLARSPRVFISYTHDTDNHKRRIVELAKRLRADGIDARIDRFVSGTPPGGWPSWMEDELEHADFIVLICTSTYELRYRQQGDPRDGLGGRWESSLVRDLLYSYPEKIGRFVPVLPRASSKEDIPLPLRVRATHYQLADYDGLFAHLSGRDLAPPLGTPPPPARSPGARRRRRDKSSASEPWGFSPKITEQYLRINRRILALTEEQYAVISQLHGRPRALISGTPGSGKTLVAAEKATRLAHAGIKTLFLCHNPLLSEWVSQLTGASMVDVRAFEDLIRELAPGGDTYNKDWTNYSEPTSEQLNAALEALLSGSPPYEAVIVDEGQDFADDWWQLVEACLPSGPEATLYIFFDERQSLLPHRMNLPPSGWPLTLSRNCRNAGRVYEVMRRLSPGSPLPDEELQELGEAQFFRATKLRDAVVHALRWCNELGVLGELAAILGGGVEFEQSVLDKGPFTYEDEVDWRELARREIRNLTRFWAAELRVSQLDPKELWALEKLSSASTPTRADIALVDSVASRIAKALPADKAEFHHPDLHWRSRRVFDTGAVIWRLSDWRGKPSRSDILNAFRCDVWLKSLPAAAAVRFAPHRRRNKDGIPVYTIADIKGLERDAVLLVMQGDAPQFMHHLFVGVSRPRSVLAVVGDDRTYAALPSQLAGLS
jgi:hypothetical protein